MVWKPFLAAGLLLTGTLSAQDGLLFRSTFDGMSVHADKSENPKCLNWANQSLALRGFPGINGKGNAAALADNEFLSYGAEKNLNPKGGTISFWFCPQKDLPEEYEHCYMQASLPNGVFTVQQAAGNPYYKNKLLLSLTIFSNGKIKQTLQAYHDVKPGTFRKDVWHKIDVTWDAEKMSLYLDGSLQKVRKEEFWRKISRSVEMFPTGFAFGDKPDSGARILFNFQRSSTPKDPANRTVYDEIEIYDHALGADQIRKNYNRYFPSKFTENARPCFFCLPAAKNGITLDGKLDSEEWTDAAILPVIRSPDSENIRNPFGSRVLLKYDKDNLYAGFRVDSPPESRKATGRDSAVYRDDCVEMHLFDPKSGKQYQFVVNANGAVYDSMPSSTEQEKWNSSLRAAASVRKDGWSAEIILPLADIGNPVSGTRWKGNFCSTSPRGKGKVYNTFSATRWGYAYIPGMSDFEWSGNVSPVKLEKLSVDDNGTLTAEFDGQGMEASAKILSEAEPDIVYHKNLAGNPWTAVRKPGLHIFRLDAAGNDGKKLLVWDYVYAVKHPLEFEYAFYPSKKEMQVKLNLYSCGETAARLLRAGGLPVSVCLKNKAGETICEKKQFVKDYSETMVLEIPVEKLSPGDYTVLASIRDQGIHFLYSRPFRVPDMTPFHGPRIAADHSVPPPWTPIRKLSERKFEVWHRIYEFGEGPWPVQITVSGKKLFTSPPEFVFRQEPAVKWSDFTVRETHPDFISFSGSGETPQLKIRWKGELWFDGMYKLDWTLSPRNGKTTIKGLTLRWSTPVELGRYVTTPVFQPWNGRDTMSLRMAPELFASNFLLWHSGLRNGISFWNQSDANWVNTPGEKQVRLTKDAESLNVSIGIISSEAVLSKPAWYTMTLLATPSRPAPVNRRLFNYERQAENVTAITLGWGSEASKKLCADDTVNWTTFLPRDPAAYNRYVERLQKDHPCSPLLGYCYNQPVALPEPDEYHDWFYPENAVLPGLFWHGTEKGTGVKFRVKPCAPDGPVADLMLYRLVRMFDTLPKLGGLYHDICTETCCNNSFHGCGGVDAFGKHYSSLTGLRLRNYLMRVYKVTRKYGKGMVNHGQEKFNPIVHVFGDYWLPGEETLYDFARNPKCYYCTDVPKESYQFKFSSALTGVGVIQLARGFTSSVSFPPGSKEYLKTESAAMNYLTPCVLHDANSTGVMDTTRFLGKFWTLRKNIALQKADFTGYWEEQPPAVSGNEGVYVSRYSWKEPSPYKVMLAIGNITGTQKNAGLSIDFAKLGVNPGKSVFRDLWEDRELTLDELKNLILPPCSFKMIGIQNRRNQ